jgi:hypothetical protein
MNDGGYKDWFVAPAGNFQGLFTLLLAYSLVITSFVGYSESTRQEKSLGTSQTPRSYPIRKPPRFIVDIVLLFLYYLLFAYAASFQTELATYSFVFGLYLAWNVMRLIEYWNIPSARRPLSYRTVIASLFFAGFLFAYWLFVTYQSQISGFQMFLLFPVLAAFILYRVINPLSRREKRNASATPQ